MAGGSMLTFGGGLSDYKKCSVSEVFKSWSLVSWRLLVALAGQKLRPFTIVMEIYFTQPLMIHSCHRATDSELSPMRDAGIQEGREVGVESGRRYIEGKHGVALWSSPSHTLCISIQIFLHLLQTHPGEQPNTTFPFSYVGVVSWGSHRLPHYFFSYLLRISLTGPKYVVLCSCYSELLER